MEMSKPVENLVMSLRIKKARAILNPKELVKFSEVQPSNFGRVSASDIFLEGNSDLGCNSSVACQYKFYNV